AGGEAGRRWRKADGANSRSMGEPDGSDSRPLATAHYRHGNRADLFARASLTAAPLTARRRRTSGGIMRIRYILLFVVMGTACRQPSHPQSPRYQIAISASGQVYRLDVVSGGVTAVGAAGTSHAPVRLVAGALYEDENGRVLKYLG